MTMEFGDLTRGVFPTILHETHADHDDPAVLGRRARGPPGRAAVYELRHIPPAAVAVLLRLPDT